MLRGCLRSLDLGSFRGDELLAMSRRRGLVENGGFGQFLMHSQVEYPIVKDGHFHWMRSNIVGVRPACSIRCPRRISVSRRSMR
jgi:hypothetical protein